MTLNGNQIAYKVVTNFHNFRLIPRPRIFLLPSSHLGEENLLNSILFTKGSRRRRRAGGCCCRRYRPSSRRRRYLSPPSRCHRTTTPSSRRRRAIITSPPRRLLHRPPPRRGRCGLPWITVSTRAAPLHQPSRHHDHV